MLALKKLGVNSHLNCDRAELIEVVGPKIQNPEYWII